MRKGYHPLEQTDLNRHFNVKSITLQETWYVCEATEDEFLELQPLEEPKEASHVKMIGWGLVGDWLVISRCSEFMVQGLRFKFNFI